VSLRLSVDNISGEIQYECRDAPRYWEYSNSASVPEYQSADSKQSSGQYENEPSNSLGPYQSPASYEYQQQGDFSNQITYQASHTPNTQTIYYPSSKHSNQDAGETFGKTPYQNYASQSQTNQGSVTNTDSLPQFSPPKNLPRSKSASGKVTVSIVQLFPYTKRKMVTDLIPASRSSTRYLHF
jgi:hypothetical protein